MKNPILRAARWFAWCSPRAARAMALAIDAVANPLTILSDTLDPWSEVHLPPEVVNAWAAEIRAKAAAKIAERERAKNLHADAATHGDA